MASFPALASERLLLRQFVLADATQVQRLAGEKEIARFTTLPHPYEDGMAESWIEKQHENYASGHIINFAIVQKQGEQLIGSIGLTLNAEHSRGELGFWIGVPFWGQGYCTEAARQIVDFGFSTLNLHRIYALHYGRNTGSGRVMQKLGMTYEGKQRQHYQRFGQWEDAELYGMLKAEYQIV